MSKWTQKKISSLLLELEEVYGRARNLPRFDPMDELVSCILSQHTADANSFPTFAELRAKYGEWHQIVDLGETKLAIEIKRAGLANQKAKSIIHSLKEIHKRNGEYSLENLREMPLSDARKWLLSLPGVGPKTAAIVLCFSFGKSAIPVDTHVFRVSWRLGIIDKMLGENKAHNALERLVDEKDAFRYHTTLIQHGRQTCKAQNPNCKDCVVSNHCEFVKFLKKDALAKGLQKPKQPLPPPSELPVAKRKGRVVRDQSALSARPKK